MNDAAPDAAPGEDPGSRCAACGRHLDVGMRFCTGCGRPTGSVDEADTGTTPLTTELPRPAVDANATTSSAPIAQPASTPRPPRGTGPVAVAEADQTICRSCGGVNRASRMLCGACGLDLATGDPRLTIRPAPAEVGSRPAGAAVADAADGPAVPWWVPALAAVLVLAAVVAAIVGLGLGPFEPSTELPPAEFEAASYPGDPDPLALTDVATLTFRAPDGSRTFTPEHLVDGDPTSAWHGGGSALPAGTDEKVDLILDRPAWVTAVVIDNGDQMDADAYASTSRVQQALLVFDGDVRVPVTLLDQGLAPQIVELEQPLLTATVRMELLTSVPGTELEEVAMSGLELLGFPAEGDDVELAEQRGALQPAAGAVPLPG